MSSDPLCSPNGALLFYVYSQVPAFESSDGNCVFESNAIAYCGRSFYYYC